MTTMHAPVESPDSADSSAAARSRATPMKGRYLVRNPVANAGLRAADAMLGAIHGARRGGAAPIPELPSRILIAVGGHLGDAVMATAMLADLRTAFPDAVLDVLSAAWNRAVFEGHPMVRQLHVVDHWKLNRAQLSRAAKVAHYIATARPAVRAIVEAKYDIAIDSYPFFPNAAGILWRSGVPVRIGYASGGFGPLYTHVLEWVDDREHIVEKQRRLTRMVTRLRALAAEPACALAPDSARVGRRLDELLDARDTRPIVLLHAGSGSAQKDWPLTHWIRLAAELRSGERTRVMLTGAGARDAAMAAEIARAVPGIESFVDRLSWSEFVGAVRRAALVVCGDTSAAHVAAACGTPHVALFTGINDASEFRPLSTRGLVLRHEVPCAPCFRGDGCETMACIRQIAPDHVLRTGLALLSKS